MLKKYYKKMTKKRKYKNISEALERSPLLKTVSGNSMLIVDYNQDPVETTFNFPGLLWYMFWCLVYLYCAYRTYSQDQTILRHLHDTKLKHYGDVFERCASIIFFLFAMWKLPFDLDGHASIIRELMDIDKAIKGMGFYIDHNNIAFSVVVCGLIQAAILLIRFISIWLTMIFMKLPLNIEMVIQYSFSDTLAATAIAYFCYNMLIEKERYEIVNTLLGKIKDREPFEDELLNGNKPENRRREVIFQEKCVCEKIKACARVNSMIFKASGTNNDVFGSTMLLTIILSLLYVILNLFYVMEASAAGMFHDPVKYAWFLNYVFWRISYYMGLVYLSIYFAEGVVCEAKRTAFIAHEIINNNLSPAITEQATQLSLQLLHEKPKFTANGVIKIDYTIILDGAHTTSTFLMLLLQYVTD